MFSASLLDRAGALIKTCRDRGIVLATAESCTGGLLAALLTEISGSVDVLDRGLVTYSNAAKHELLGVPHDVIADHGAVSSATALAMASGALSRSHANLAVAVTGIAGPTGGSPEKPIGLVHFGLAQRGGRTLTVEKRYGDVDRRTVRLHAVEDALRLLEDSVAAG